MSPRTLDALLGASAHERPAATAVIEPGHGAITYRELAALSDAVRDRLVALGVRPGDRVGLNLAKSIDAVAAIFGVLKAGAAYVPVDPGAPAARGAYILNDCAVRAVVVEAGLEPGLGAELAAHGADPARLVLEGTGGGVPLRAALVAVPAPAAPPVDVAPDDVAYILYTSGSTGTPKGVVLTHHNAMSFVDWCSAAFEPTADDVFSSHAPFHFDLSILDLYVPLKHGATLVLVSSDAGKDPQALAELIAGSGITVWYSAPSILAALAQFGRLETRPVPALRWVLFAGEVFPVRHLRALQRRWPHPRYANLYGPTETNVCTWYELTERVPDGRTAPYPIGRVCPQLRGRVVDAEGRDVPGGGEGELVIAGPNVMREYWNLPEQTAGAFLVARDGERWYRTGDVVTTNGDGDLEYVGRRDRMVKRRGYRVELAEIEAGLYRHAAIREAAVVALPDAEGVRIRAFVNAGGAKLSLIALKKHCADTLPIYMVPDEFVFLDGLPKTSTDKVDYQRLLART